MNSEENYLNDLENSLDNEGEINSIDIPEAPDMELPDLDINLESEPDISLSDIELPDIPDEPLTELLPEGTPENLPDEEQLLNEITELEESLVSENIEMPEETPKMSEMEEDFKLEDLEMPDLPDLPDISEELSIDGLEEAIQSETELEMAGELNTDELKIDELDFGEGADNGADSEAEAAEEDDNSLEDVLNMLDDDAELAEINDMLKKSDNKEPIQDDMMDILHQMADDEAASVNAGVKHVDDDDDGGVPLPEIPPSVLNPDAAKSTDEADNKDNEDGKKKGKKDKKNKKNKKGESETGKDNGGSKEPGKMGKLLNMLTEELVPEPTEEELAAEKEAKAAKKQEELTKKEEEKLAKEEEKKVKAEEKEAAKKAKQEAAAQKKKEKQAAKEAKLAAKRAKEAAEGKKKRIPPKKIAAAALFGATVGGAVILSTNILSKQGYLQSARNAYYDQDYKAVYQAVFDIELNDTEDIGLIKARSEVILKMQRRYDSYQTYIKMGMEKEALDALLQGIATYDFVNADAEKYEVAEEVEKIKTDILNTLAAKYNIDESRARELANTSDALTYTIALDDIINAN